MSIHPEDWSLNAHDLCSKYGPWGSHPEFPATDWRREVADGDTRLGYWDWVECQIEELEGCDGNDDSIDSSTSW